MNIDALETMLAEGTDNAMLRYTLGKAYFDRGDFSVAVGHLRHAVAQDAAYSAAWKWLGRTLTECGDDEQARQAFEAGIAAAAKKGDKQAEKEMRVFLRRLDKQ